MWSFLETNFLKKKYKNLTFIQQFYKLEIKAG